MYIYNEGIYDDNSLLFYNKTLKKNLFIKKKHSFSKFPNGLYLISKEDKKKNITLCVPKIF